MSDCRKDWV